MSSFWYLYCADIGWSAFCYSNKISEQPTYTKKRFVLGHSFEVSVHAWWIRHFKVCRKAAHHVSSTWQSKMAHLMAQEERRERGRDYGSITHFRGMLPSPPSQWASSRTHLSLSFLFFFFSGTGVWSQDSVFVRHYHQPQVRPHLLKFPPPPSTTSLRIKPLTHEPLGDILRSKLHNYTRC
jgi:hypothetical protein